MTADKERIERLQAELQRARELVFQTAKLAEMGKMVAVVAHELSQPLLGIKAFAQILRRRFKNDSFIGPKVKMIEEQAVHMETILNSLRRFSKVPEMAATAVAPRVAIDAALELYSERAKKLRVRLVVESPDELPDVHIRQGHLQQVVVNLVGNAMDELEDRKGGLILLRLEPHEPGVRLLVADTGGGLPAAARARLFEPFFTTKGSEKGTGLGLSICRDILRLYQGDIRLMEDDEVENAFGAGFGAAFEIRLKTANEEPGPVRE